MTRALTLFCCMVFLQTACQSDMHRVANDSQGADRAQQIAFRVRSDFSVGLNQDRGWAAEPNENVAIVADRPFRIRFEIERQEGAKPMGRVRLQYRRNGDAWLMVEAHDFPYPDTEDAKTPRVSIVACSAFESGDPTEDLLGQSTLPFGSGLGVSLREGARLRVGEGQQTEVEWALVVRRFADGAVLNEAGDTFEFRMVGSNGVPLEGVAAPALQLAVPDGHVGGTFVETPGRIGPWRASNGDLYFIMEPTETDNVFMVVKSEDGGRTWREADAANRPATDDLESVDGRLVGDTIHIIHQVTESVRYHSFRTADHPMYSDTWDTKDELAATTESIAQAATLSVRSDGSMVAFFVGPTLEYSVRSPQGDWSEKERVETDGSRIYAGPQSVADADDTVHIAYYGADGSIWYRSLTAEGTLTPRQQLAIGAGVTRSEYNAALPLLYLPEEDTVVVAYRLDSGELYERRVRADGSISEAKRVSDRTVVRDAVDSQQPGADIVVDGNTIHVLFIDSNSRSIFHVSDRDGWQPSTLIVEDILGSWVRGSVYTRSDGKRVYGFVYDAGSLGGAGMNRFAELVLEP